MEIGDILYQQFPLAKILFVYRNAETWANSVSRSFGDTLPPPDALPQMLQWLASVTPSQAGEIMALAGDFSPGKLLALLWLSVIQHYLQFHLLGYPVLAVRFEDLKANPLRVTRALLDFCGVSVSDTERLQELLKRDSQAGTALAQERLQRSQGVLVEEDLAELRRTLRMHPRVQTPDFILPGTLQVS